MNPARALRLAVSGFAMAAVLALPAAAGSLDLDGGLRASIYNDNYKLGVGAELGAVQNLGPKTDLGLHLNYSRFRAKTVDWVDVNEFGGYVTWYFLPTLADQPFEVRLGPHVGAAMIEDDWFADVGGDIAAVFKVGEKLRFYGAFIPGYFIGSESQGMFRVGFGLQYRVGEGSAPAATGYEGAAGTP
jgi:hypothetical protein